MIRRRPKLLKWLGICLPLAAVCVTGVAREPLFKPAVGKKPSLTIPLQPVQPAAEAAPAQPATAAEVESSLVRPTRERTPLFKPPAVQSVLAQPKEAAAVQEPVAQEEPAAVKEEQPAQKAPAEEVVTEAAEAKPNEAEPTPAPQPIIPLEPALAPVQPQAVDAPPPPPSAPETKPEPKPLSEVQPPPRIVPPVPPVPVLPQEELPPADPLAGTPKNPTPLPEELPLAAVGTSIAPRTGRLPLDRAVEWEKQKAAEGYLFAEVGVVYFWDAPNFCYQPLYYEQPNVERLGYSKCALLQPATSGIQFFAQTLALPYQMTVHPYRRECMYPLGHYRPGNPAPFRYIYPEWNARAAAVQAAATTGLIFVLP